MKFVSVKTGETGHVVPVWQLSQPRLEMSQTCRAGRASDAGRQVGPLVTLSSGGTGAGDNNGVLNFRSMQLVDRIS